tara:strand:+ start:67 stop:630 length:564 start_codon:yes stop_codon:yes gene_type:complete
MIKIGITGSISSGKTTVANILAGRNHPLFDADKEVSKIYGSPLFKTKVSRKFGLKSKKNIKDKIKKIIFKNKNNLKILEKIIHPIVRKNMKSFIKRNKSKKILIFEIPLLVESKLMKNFDIIILVISKKKLRLKRYIKKSKNKKIFDVLNKRQLGPAKKRKFCDFVISNNYSLKVLKKNAKNIIYKI